VGTEHLVFLFQSIALINLFFIVGKLVFNVFLNIENKTGLFWYTNFLYLIIGAFFIIVAFAMIKTGGLSILSLSLLPLGVLCYQTKFRYQSPRFGLRRLFDWKINLILLISFAIIYYTSQVGGPLLDSFHPDLHLYEDIAFHLGKGFENTFGSLNDTYFENDTIRTPYHYFELWLAAFAGGIFSQESYVYVLQLVVIPLLITLTIIGLLAIWERYNHINKYSFVIIGFLLMFIGPVQTMLTKGFVTNFEELTSKGFVVFENSSHLNHFLLFKNFPFYILSIFFILKYLSRQYINALLILMFGLVLNVGLIPGILMVLFIVPLLLVFKKQITLKEGLMLGTTAIVLILGIYFFYFQFSPARLDGLFNEAAKGKSMTYQFFQIYNTKGEIIRFFFRTFFPWVFLLLLYAPFVMYYVYVWHFKKKRDTDLKNLIFISIIMISGGILTRPFLQGSNSIQFLSFLLPFLNCVVIVFMAISYKNQKLIVVLILLSGLVSNFKEINIYINQNDGKPTKMIYSTDYKNKVIKELKKDVSVKIGWIMNEVERRNTDPIFWMYSAPTLFMNTYGLHSYYNLNNPKIDNVSQSEDCYTNQLKFLAGPKKVNNTLLIKLFVEKYDLRYVVLKNGVDMKKYSFLNLRLLYKDTYSGERFCVIQL